jgi:hypothetical protein
MPGSVTGPHCSRGKQVQKRNKGKGKRIWRSSKTDSIKRNRRKRSRGMEAREGMAVERGAEEGKQD